MEFNTQYGKMPEIVTADAGYGSEDNYLFLVILNTTRASDVLCSQGVTKWRSKQDCQHRTQLKKMDLLIHILDPFLFIKAENQSSQKQHWLVRNYLSIFWEDGWMS
jgi:hypothetical protein